MDEFECKLCYCRRVEAFVGQGRVSSGGADAVEGVRTVQRCDPGFGSVFVILESFQ